MKDRLRLLAGALLAIVGCYFLHRALYRFLSHVFESRTVPWVPVAGFLLLCAASLWGADRLWKRWRLAFGTTAMVIGVFTYRIFVSVGVTKELYPWVRDLWVHRELWTRKILMVVFLTLGVVTYYYDYWRHRRRQPSPEGR